MWRQSLAHYYREHDIDPATLPAGPGRRPFDAAAADRRPFEVEYRAQRADGQLAWIADQEKQVEHLVSVCTGAYVLAELGLLDGLEANVERVTFIPDRKSVV